MSKGKRGGSAAGTAIGVRGELRWRLLRFYARDPGFAAALEALWTIRTARVSLGDDWRTTPPLFWIDQPSTAAVRREFELRAEVRRLSPAAQAAAWAGSFAPVAEYVDALVEVAETFGLDHLGAEGIDALHAWCVGRQTYGDWWTAARFGEEYAHFGPVPEVGEEVLSELEPFEIEGQRYRVTERDVRPVVRVAGGEARWDPTLESRRHAFARLRGRFGKRAEPAIRAELDRLESLAEEAGARAVDTRPNVERDLEWLYWHLRYREGPAQVTERARCGETNVMMVLQAVRRVARLADIPLRTGWAHWPTA